MLRIRWAALVDWIGNKKMHIKHLLGLASWALSSELDLNGRKNIFKNENIFRIN
jgi:hypothetical protein